MITLTGTNSHTRQLASASECSITYKWVVSFGISLGTSRIVLPVQLTMCPLAAGCVSLTAVQPHAAGHVTYHLWTSDEVEDDDKAAKLITIATKLSIILHYMCLHSLPLHRTMSMTKDEKVQLKYTCKHTFWQLNSFSSVSALKLTLFPSFNATELN